MVGGLLVATKSRVDIVDQGTQIPVRRDSLNINTDGTRIADDSAGPIGTMRDGGIEFLVRPIKDGAVFHTDIDFF